MRMMLGWIAWVRECWIGLYNATLNFDSRELKDEQAAILAKTSFFFTVLGMGSVNLFMFDFRNQLNVFIVLAYGWIVLSYFAWSGASLVWMRSRRHELFLAICTSLTLGLGIAWGLLVNLFSIMATEEQKGPLIGLTMALVSTPMLGVPVQVGLAFWFPVAAFGAVAILYTLEPLHAAAVLSFLGFLVFSLVGLVFLNRTILERSIGRLNLQRQHRALNIFLREYQENASDWLWETDIQGRLHNVVPRMTQTFGCDSSALEGRLLNRVLRRPDTAAADDPDLSTLLERRAAFRDLLVVLETPDGNRWLSLTGHPAFDEYGAFCGFRGVGCDVTEAKQSQDRIAFMAGHDGLTGLLNRQNFLDRIQEACRCPLSDPTAPVFALLLIDLDQFKPINDDYGHGAGDAVLVTVANRLRESVRHSDHAARLGGDEFAVLLRLAQADDATEVTRRLLQALGARISFNGIPIQPRASIGVALFPQHAGNALELMKRADLALYEAKNGGRNTYRFFEEGMQAALEGRLRLQTDLSAACDRGDFFVAYQPIFDLHSGRIISSEALVRWRHETRGIVTAGDFIPVAEEAGLIDRIGEFVLDEACRAAMSWGDLPVVVNLSPRQLRSDRFLEVLTSCLARSGLPPERLGLEVTETVFLALTERSAKQIEAIRKLGVRLMLDDFGTGYSSLTYLRTFEFDGLKIDAAFTRDLPQSRKVAAIIRTVARLASDLGMSLTAEGVESREQLVWLRANGVSLAQGFLLARPQTAAQISDLLASGGAANRILREF